MRTTQTKNTLKNQKPTVSMVNQDDECLPKVAEMILESMHFADDYTKARSYRKTGITNDGITAIGLARLNWLLEEGRRELIGIFTPAEFATMCTGLQDEICELSSLNKIVGVVADDLGLDPDTYEESPHADLINRLLALSTLQSVALRDLLEEFWHVGMHTMSCAEFLNKKGLN